MAVTGTKFSQISSGGDFNPATDQFLAVRSTSTSAFIDVLVAPGGVPGRTITSSGTINMATSDAIVNINKATSAVTTIITPVAPTNFKPYTIKDAAGNAAAFPITIEPYSGAIDGQATFVINGPYGAVTLYWDGSNYSIQSVR